MQLSPDSQPIDEAIAELDRVLGDDLLKHQVARNALENCIQTRTAGHKMRSHLVQQRDLVVLHQLRVEA